MLIGALAASEYRQRPRFTTDVDFMLVEFGDVAERLAAEGYDIKEMAEPGGEPYLIFVRGKGVKVDLLRAETEYHRGALARARNGVLTVEDVIVNKLMAWRPRDQDDIDSIVSAGHDLDVAYIERWASEWDVADRWMEARRRGG